jgi:glycosyltransferase involved in cell wall biosynthesis
VSVLLLTPSRGLGGGIERYVDTVRAAFAASSVRCRRLDLIDQDRPHGTLAKVHFGWSVRRAVREAEEPVRLVVAHRNLLPVLRLVDRLDRYGGASVILHGCEIWSGRQRARHLLRRGDVRVVAVSQFSAGALVGTCPASVLSPGVSEPWYRILVSTDGTPREPHRIVTVFRLADWRDKGLDTLLSAVRTLGDERVTVTVCGSGPVPAELATLVAGHPFCRITAGLGDAELARELAGAGVLVLATRTRAGSHAYGEGFGMVLMEAQLAGTPVVAPAYGGSGDAYQPGLTGFAPVDESPEALAAVLGPLLRDGDLRERMGRAAADWSRTRFDPAVYARRAVAVLLGQASSEPLATANRSAP